MQLKINGQDQQQPDGMNLSGLLRSLSLDPRRLAVELNRRLVKRGDFQQTVLHDGDVLEIVTLVGGG